MKQEQEGMTMAINREWVIERLEKVAGEIESMQEGVMNQHDENTVHWLQAAIIRQLLIVSRHKGEGTLIGKEEGADVIGSTLRTIEETWKRVKGKQNF